MQLRADDDDGGVLPAACSRLTRARETRAPVRDPVPVEVDGVFLGIAVAHEMGVQFVATHASVTAMDQSVWPSVAYAQSSAQQLFKAGLRGSIDRDSANQIQRWWRRIWGNVRRHPSAAGNYMPANIGVER